MTADRVSFGKDYTDGKHRFLSNRNKAFWQEILQHITGKHHELMSFEKVRRRLHLHEELHRGVRDVPLDQIVGSVGRYKDFTASFLPKNSKLAERWSRVYAATNSLEGLPPIELYKVGDAYFVRDGNHRVSVARELGNKTIQAHVVELPTTVPMRPGMSDREFEAAEAYAHFLDETGLARAVPKHESIELSAPTRYHELMGFIFLHERVMEKVEGHPLTTEEVTADWYLQVYRPAVDLIRKYKVLELAKGRKSQRTEGDLFLWLMNNLLLLRHQYGDDAPVKSFSGAIKTYLEEEHVAVPDTLAGENDESVVLTRRQVSTARERIAARRQDQDDPDPGAAAPQVN